MPLFSLTIHARYLESLGTRLMTDTSPLDPNPQDLSPLRPGWRHREPGFRRPAAGQSNSIQQNRTWLDRFLAKRGITGRRRRRLLHQLLVGGLLLGVAIISFLLMSLLSKEVFEAVPTLK